MVVVVVVCYRYNKIIKEIRVVINQLYFNFACGTEVSMKQPKWMF